MKIAVLTATLKNDYNWHSSDNSFKSFARDHKSCWHNEVYDGAWFGLTSQNGQTFFLAGKIPTKRRDSSNRSILDYIVMQSQSPKDRELWALLTSDLLKKRQDINDVDSPFTLWVDDICTTMAETESFNGKPLPILEASLSSKSGVSIGRFEYPLNCMEERNNAANALGSLLEIQKDFLVGCIQYPVEKFLDKLNNAGYELSNAQIAVFSARTDSKKKLMGAQHAISKRNQGSSSKPNQNNGATSNKEQGSIFNPFTVGVCLLILVAAFSQLWYQNSQKTNQIQNLTSLVQDMTTLVQSLSGQIQTMSEQNQRLKSQVETMETNFINYSKYKLEKNDEISSLNNNYNELKTFYTDLNKNYKNLNDNYNTFQSDLKSLKDDITLIKDSIKDINEKIDKLKEPNDQSKGFLTPPQTTSGRRSKY